VEPRDGGPDRQASRVTALYERLARLVRRLRPGRVEALREHLDEQEQTEATKGTDNGPRPTDSD